MESGLHFCFTAKSRGAVDAFHATALKNGGKDNGKPGVRTDRIEAYCGSDLAGAVIGPILRR